jgi:hypothetical protein
LVVNGTETVAEPMDPTGIEPDVVFSGIQVWEEEEIGQLELS